MQYLATPSQVRRRRFIYLPQETGIYRDDSDQIVTLFLVDKRLMTIDQSIKARFIAIADRNTLLANVHPTPINQPDMG
jgi:hypothetical protein